MIELQFFEEFENVKSFVETIKKRPVTNNFKESSHTLGTLGGFRELETFDQASEALYTGWAKGYELFRQLDRQRMDISSIKDNMVNRRKRIDDVVGYAPIVPNAIANLPYTMERMTEKEKLARILHEQGKS